MSDAERGDEVEEIAGPAPAEDSSLPPDDDEPAIEGESVDVDAAERDGHGPPGGGRLAGGRPVGRPGPW